MYEPYEEKKRSKLKEFINNLRDKFQGFWQELYFQKFKGNLWGIIIIPVVLLLMVGLAYTGYVTYTSRITQTQSKLLLLERQINVLQEELNQAQNKLNTCSAELEDNKGELSQTKSNLEKTQSNLDTCAMEREELSNELSKRETSLGELQNKYDVLLNSYNTMQCNYAKSKGCLSYTVKDSDVRCCFKIDKNYYCGFIIPVLTPEEEIKSC